MPTDFMQPAAVVDPLRTSSLAAVRLRTREGALSIDTAELGLWIFLGSVTMLFAGFTSAYLVRQTTGDDWQPIPVPPLLWLTTPLLVASSLTIERARRGGAAAAASRWTTATLLLGFAFLAGQLGAWRQLAAQGHYLPTSPHSAFFYILTGAHGAHLAGGLAAILVALVGTWRAPGPPRNVRRLKLAAIYWHFLGAMWLYLFAVLFLL